MMKKCLIYIIGILLILFLLPIGAFAAKPRVRTRPATLSLPGSRGLGYSAAKLSRITNSIVVTFKNLETVERSEYLLSYVGKGLDQGVAGSFIPSGQGSESRDLYFGTCSHGVCTPHRNITNAILLVTTRLKSGARHVKRYRIKV